jgi:hypothetical protein
MRTTIVLESYITNKLSETLVQAFADRRAFGNIMENHATG